MKKALFCYSKMCELAFLRGAPKLDLVKKPFFVELEDGWAYAVQQTKHPMESQPPRHRKVIVPSGGAAIWKFGVAQAIITRSDVQKFAANPSDKILDEILTPMLDRLATAQVSINMGKIAKKMEA